VLEDPNVCAICGAAVSGYVGGVPVYFCPKCFEAFGGDILAKAKWIVFLLGEEKARRKRRNRLIKSVGLPVFIYGIPHQWEAGYTISTRLYPYRQGGLPAGG
jgi:hypothetical protein